MARFIYMIRHGEPEEGFTKRFLGRMDPGLSPVGVRQAEEAAERLREMGVRRVVSSPLLRARATAERIADVCTLDVEVNPLLLEIDFGRLEGLTFKEASELFPGTTDSWQALSGDFSFPGGESFHDFDRRCEVAATFAREAEGENVLLVAHGGVLRGILCHLLAVEADGPLRFRLAYGALTTVEVCEDGGGVLHGFNVGPLSPPAGAQTFRPYV